MCVYIWASLGPSWPISPWGGPNFWLIMAWAIMAHGGPKFGPMVPKASLGPSWPMGVPSWGPQ